MKFEIKLSFTIRRDHGDCDHGSPQGHDSSTDALVERAEDGRSPELDERVREPLWEDRQIGFQRSAHH